MLEISTSGLMSGDGKRSEALQSNSHRARPRLYLVASKLQSSLGRCFLSHLRQGLSCSTPELAVRAEACALASPQLSLVVFAEADGCTSSATANLG